MTESSLKVNRAKNVRNGILAGAVNNVLCFVLPFVSRTIIIYVFGSAYLGLNGLFNSLINVLNISELGFGAALSYLLYKPIAENDKDKVCAILAFGRKAFHIIGMVVLGLGLSLIPFLDNLISSDRPPEINIVILFLLYLVNSVVSYFTFSYKRILFSASQRYDIETTIASGTLIFQYIFQIVLLLTTHNYYLFVAMTIVASIANNILCQTVTRRLYPEYERRGKISSQDKGVVLKTLKGVFLSKLGSVIFLAAGNIIISCIFGLNTLGIYTNYYYVITMLLSFFAIMHNSLRPTLGNCILTDSKDTIYERLINLTHMYTWLSTVAACGMLCLYQEFVYLWAGQDFLLPQVFVFLFTGLFYVDRLCCIPSIFVEASGLWYESRLIYLLAASIVIVGGFVLSKLLGLSGVPLAYMASSAFACVVGYVIVLFKYFFEDKKREYSYFLFLFRNVALQVMSMALILWASSYFKADTIPLFLVKGLLVTVMSVLCYMVLGRIDIQSYRYAWQLCRSLIKR